MSSKAQANWYQGRPEPLLNTDGAQKYWFKGRPHSGFFDLTPTNWTASVEADGVASASFSGKRVISGKFEADGVGTVQASISAQHSGAFACNGVASNLFDGRRTCFGSIEADGLATNVFAPSVIISSGFSSSGVATANFSIFLHVGGAFQCSGIATVSVGATGTISGKFEADGIGTLDFAGTIDQAKYWFNGLPITSLIGNNSQLFWYHGLPSARIQTTDGQINMNGVGSMLVNSTTIMIASARTVAQGMAGAVFQFSRAAVGGPIAHGVGSSLFRSNHNMGGRFECDGVADHILFITNSNGVPIEGLISSLPPAVFPSGASVGILFDSPHSY